MAQTIQPEDRLREHPRDRFQFDKRVFDLNELTEKIKNESLSEEHYRQGHRQIVLLRELPQTIALYQFDEDGWINEHAVDGVVSIQVLDGELVVSANGEDRVLKAGNVMIINEGEPHSVRANEESRMLLTICWNGRG